MFYELDTKFIQEQWIITRGSSSHAHVILFCLLQKSNDLFQIKSDNTKYLDDTNEWYRFEVYVSV